MRAADVARELEALGDPGAAAHARCYFKAGPGQYAEGDRFLGIRVPVLRGRVRRFRELPLSEVEHLLGSPFHEARLLALLLLVDRFRRGDPAARAAVAEVYLRNLDRVNHWDLVDASAPHILGPYLEGRDRSLLDRLAASPSLWERRVAVMATFHFIRRGAYAPTLRLVRRLLDDPEDLIHKAAGWMLREVGKRDEETLLAFLEENAARMPRTMLRYATERLDPERQRRFRRA
ncbi:DNA alkylation repair protein [Oceanithermus profundus]